MKNITITIVLLLAAFCVSGKKKVDPKDAKIDSLTVQNKSLTLKLDSISGDLATYTGVYVTLKEKVFKYNFDPAKTSFLIDSLRTSRDTSSMLLSGMQTMSHDSILMLLNQNSVLKAKMDSIKIAWDKEKTTIPIEEIENAKAISGLKQLKELLDDKIISDTEFLTLKKKYVDKL